MLKPSFKRLSQLETDAWHQVSTQVAAFWYAVAALKAIRWQLQIPSHCWLSVTCCYDLLLSL